MDFGELCLSHKHTTGFDPFLQKGAKYREGVYANCIILYLKFANPESHIGKGESVLKLIQPKIRY